MKQPSFLSNLTATVTITTLFVLLTVSGASAGTPQKIGAGYDIEISRMIPMRDGVELEAWIFKPSHPTDIGPGTGKTKTVYKHPRYCRTRTMCLAAT